MKEVYYFVKTYLGEWIIAEYLDPCWIVTGDENTSNNGDFVKIGNFLGHTSEEIEQSNKEIGVINALKSVNG